MFKCELCHSFLPFEFVHKGMVIDLLEIEVPLCRSYFIMETVSTSPYFKILHVIIPDKKGIIVGKANYCDMIIKDEMLGLEMAKF
jgi:hypothetical protein